ncbi:ABC transporter substrate-binding protein [Chelativorans xinjiangense]|uniref:ABC transporter substrate-binding protein n=1 Tax=Chelativorans xinjiangense TaxID=2681485 RepID=UPI00135B01C9|nr:sugar ABC transporter substrate-binding protein [Chelativorans xinjiangense]
MSKWKGIANTAATAVCLAALALPARAETLTFVSWMKGEPGYGDWWNEVIAKFESEHPGVEVEMTKVERSTYADTMFTMFAGGSPPDIVHLAAFEYQPFADEGWLEDLGPWIERAGLDLNGWAGQETCEWKGQTYCLMLLYTAYIFAYNEQALNEAGVENLPSDWESFLDAARKATRDTDGDGVTDVYGLGLDTTGGTNMMHDMLHFVLDAGGAWTVDGEPAFDSPAVVEALTRWKTLVDEKLTPRDTPSGDLRQLMVEGRLAMRLDGPWIYNILKGAEPEIAENLKLAPSPFSPPVGGTSNVIGMPAELAPEKKELVWEFIATVASAEMQQRFAQLGSSPAPRPGLDYTKEIETIPYFELFAQANDAAAAAGVDRLPKGLEIEFNEVAKVVHREVQGMLIEDRDPAETGQAIQTAVEAILQ